MDKNMLIEIFGYIGSLLVLVSFLMVSVVKLRIVNTIGSVIFMIYALIIKSYPTAIMNFFLVLINLHFLYRLNKKDDNEYSLVKVNKDDTFLRYLLDTYHDDIKEFFPDIDFSFKDMNKGYIIMCQGKPVGVTLGKQTDNVFDILLDYTIKEFRDFSIGRYLFSKLPEDGIKDVIYKGPTEKHTDYLKNMGFTQIDDYYTKHLD